MSRPIPAPGPSWNRGPCSSPHRAAEASTTASTAEPTSSTPTAPPSPRPTWSTCASPTGYSPKLAAATTGTPGSLRWRRSRQTASRSAWPRSITRIQCSVCRPPTRRPATPASTTHSTCRAAASSKSSKQELTRRQVGITTVGTGFGSFAEATLCSTTGTGAWSTPARSHPQAPSTSWPRCISREPAP